MVSLEEALKLKKGDALAFGSARIFIVQKVEARGKDEIFIELIDDEGNGSHATAGDLLTAERRGSIASELEPEPEKPKPTKYSKE